MFIFAELLASKDQAPAGAIECAPGVAAGTAKFPTLAAAEELMARAWEVGLRGKSPDPHTEYWKFGINVNRALDIIREIWLTTGIDFPANMFVEAPTISRMAAKLYEGTGLQPQSVVRMRDGDERAPLFLFPGGTGLLMEYTDFLQGFDHPGAIYGLPLSGMDGKMPYATTIPEEAERAVRLIRRTQPSGPYRLLGYSSGGCVTLEAARLLRNEGRAVEFLGLLDTGLTDHHWPLPVWLSYMIPQGVAALRKRALRPSAPALREHAPRPRPRIIPGRRGTRYEFRFRSPRKPNYPYFSPYWRGDITPRDGQTRFNSLRMWGLYKPAPYEGSVAFYVAKGVNPVSCAPTQYWSRHLTQIEWIPVPGNHITMMVGRYGKTLAAEVSKRLAKRL